VSKHAFSWKDKPRNPQGLPTVCVVRFGAWGDTVQAASVCAELKRQGFWVTLMCSYPGSEIVARDPSIDEMITYMQDTIPVNWLGHLWAWMREKWHGQKFDRWVNLTESVEQNCLAVAGSVKFEWAPAVRHGMMNVNYLELQHALAKVPHNPSFKFYPTTEETKWAREELARMKKAGIQKFILWGLAGSSRIHKVYPHQDIIWKHVLQHYRDWGIVTVGDGSLVDLEAGFEAEPRVWKTCGKWNMRQVATMIEYAGVVLGPETGLMSMAAFYPAPKIVILSHSTQENLTRDWVNTTALYAPATTCPGRGANEAPACHQMHADFTGCRRHEEFGTAQCVGEIKPEWVWGVLQRAMVDGHGGPWPPLVVSKTGE
jgi:ADP-heptose:LPS heptosyltransferase